ncbi:MAG TPA: DUF6491 family protein [Steroidobacteraceae bacterium]|nr:DUF6491 family protein [Steroidobacteraceae bacterium]
MGRQLLNTACVALALAALLIGGCAGTRQREGEISDRDRYWHYAKEEVPSFSSLGRISGWRPLGRNELVVWTRFDEAYILRVDPGCFELDTAIGIRLESRVSGMISSGFDWVRVGRDRCRILKIFPMDYRLMKQEERELRQQSKQDGS